MIFLILPAVWNGCFELYILVFVIVREVVRVVVGLVVSVVVSVVVRVVVIRVGLLRSNAFIPEVWFAKKQCFSTGFKGVSKLHIHMLVRV